MVTALWLLAVVGAGVGLGVAVGLLLAGRRLCVVCGAPGGVLCARCALVLGDDDEGGGSRCCSHSYCTVYTDDPSGLCPGHRDEGWREVELDAVPPAKGRRVHVEASRDGHVIVTQPLVKLRGGCWPAFGPPDVRH